MPPSHSSHATSSTGLEHGSKLEPNQFRILIVDDKAANRLILSRLLNRTGYLTLEADDGLHALKQINNRSSDLIIMDVEMPNMDGLEAIRQIRALRDPRLSSLPILAATGNPQEESQRELMTAGANAFLTKPFDAAILFKTIGQLLSPCPSPRPTFTSESPSLRISQSKLWEGHRKIHSYTDISIDKKTSCGEY